MSCIYVKLSKSEDDMNRIDPRCPARCIARTPAAAAFVGMLIGALPAHAEMSAEELAKLAQNPVGNLISLPFQNNTNLNFGPDKGTQNILNIQPVVPISISSEWNIITRTIVPVRLRILVGANSASEQMGARFTLGFFYRHICKCTVIRRKSFPHETRRDVLC